MLEQEHIEAIEECVNFFYTMILHVKKRRQYFDSEADYRQTIHECTKLIDSLNDVIDKYYEHHYRKSCKSI